MCSERAFQTSARKKGPGDVFMLYIYINIDCHVQEPLGTLSDTGTQPGTRLLDAIGPSETKMTSLHKICKGPPAPQLPLPENPVDLFDESKSLGTVVVWKEIGTRNGQTTRRSF